MLTRQRKGARTVWAVRLADCQEGKEVSTWKVERVLFGCNILMVQREQSSAKQKYADRKKGRGSQAATEDGSHGKNEQMVGQLIVKSAWLYPEWVRTECTYGTPGNMKRRRTRDMEEKKSTRSLLDE